MKDVSKAIGVIMYTERMGVTGWYGTLRASITPHVLNKVYIFHFSRSVLVDRAEGVDYV